MFLAYCVTAVELAHLLLYSLLQLLDLCLSGIHQPHCPAQQMLCVSRGTPANKCRMTCCLHTSEAVQGEGVQILRDKLLFGLGLQKLLVCSASVGSAVDPPQQVVALLLQLGAVHLHGLGRSLQAWHASWWCFKDHAALHCSPRMVLALM